MFSLKKQYFEGAIRLLLIDKIKLKKTFYSLKMTVMLLFFFKILYFFIEHPLLNAALLNNDIRC